MVKKLFLFILNGLFISGFAFAGKQPSKQSVFITTSVQPGDTTILKDSLTNQPSVLIKDPKLGFKDLFVGSTLGNRANSSQLNPRAISFVQDYIDKHNSNLKKMKEWGKPYFNMIDAILVQHGLPKELKYLSVIESRLNSSAISWAGAVGPWQFMPGTARRMGLIVGKYKDDRTDYFKSTHAAARYLTELFGIYGDWLLVIAAYNGGAGNVNSAIRRSGSRNFWDLQYQLPAESRNHVKKFIATHYIMEGQGGLTTLTKQETKDLIISFPDNFNNTLEIPDTKKLTISGKYNSVV
ncbi:MAG: transglycosylase SLT domain-containing protein, partial [Bacteroidota bacterium]|nr:transglycosylase SLT domain-containing protein [Bacteroidota bacterium]